MRICGIVGLVLMVLTLTVSCEQPEFQDPPYYEKCPLVQDKYCQSGIDGSACYIETSEGKFEIPRAAWNQHKRFVTRYCE